MKVFGFVGWGADDRVSLLMQLKSALRRQQFTVTHIRQCAAEYQQRGENCPNRGRPSCSFHALEQSEVIPHSVDAFEAATVDQLNQLLLRFPEVDICLVEGFRALHFPKMLVVPDDADNRSADAQLLSTACRNVKGIIYNHPLLEQYDAPLFHRDNIHAIATMMLSSFGSVIDIRHRC